MSGFSFYCTGAVQLCFIHHLDGVPFPVNGIWTLLKVLALMLLRNFMLEHHILRLHLSYQFFLYDVCLYFNSLFVELLRKH